MLTAMESRSASRTGSLSSETQSMISEPSTPMAKPRKPQIGYRALVSVEVLVRVDSHHRGIVTEASVDGSIILVSMLGGKYAGSEIRVDRNHLVPRQPCQEHAKKQGLVKVLDGPCKDAIGWLRGIARQADTSSSACVELSTGEVRNFELELVAIAHAPRKIRSVPQPSNSAWSLAEMRE